MHSDSHVRTVAVIVNWNGVELLRRGIPTVLEQSQPFWRTVVVDNGSHDGSREYLDRQPGVETIRSEVNLGFAKAANLGIELALEDLDTDLVATINNDVVLELDWHEQAMRTLHERPELAGCATCLLRSGPRMRVNTAGIDWSEDGWAENHLSGEPPPPPSAPAQPVFGVSAAAGLFRRELFERVGLFDESFFAYQEDVDLALRAHSLGYAFALAPAARGRHVGHASNRSFPVAGTWADFFNARNRLAVLAKSVPRQQWRRSWRRIVMTQLGALVKSVPEGRWSAVIAGILQGIVRLPFSLRARYRPIAGAAHPSAGSLHTS